MPGARASAATASTRQTDRHGCRSGRRAAAPGGTRPRAARSRRGRAPGRRPPRSVITSCRTPSPRILDGCRSGCLGTGRSDPSRTSRWRSPRTRHRARSPRARCVPRAARGQATVTNATTDIDDAAAANIDVGGACRSLSSLSSTITRRSSRGRAAAPTHRADDHGDPDLSGAVRRRCLAGRVHRGDHRRTLPPGSRPEQG